MVSRTLADHSGVSARRRISHPTEYAGLRLRMLASRGLYQDNAQQTAAALDQDAIGTWMDTKRPYLKFVQATAGNKPKLLVAATPAGGNAVRFTAASNTLLACAGLSATAGVRAMDFRVQEHTMIGALRVWEAPTANSIIFSSNSIGNFYGSVSNSVTGQLRHAFINNAASTRTTGTATAAFTVGSWFVAAWRLSKTAGDYVTGDMLQYIKSSSGVTVSTARAAEGSTQNVTSTQWNFGGLTSASSPVSIDIAEWNVYGGALTDAEIDELIGELMTEHSIT